MNRVDNIALQTLVDGDAALATWDGEEIHMPLPAGLAIHDVLVGGVAEDVVFVTDPSSSTVYGFSLDGQLLDWVNLGLPAGSLAGITFDAIGDLWLADPLGNQILRISAPR